MVKRCWLDAGLLNEEHSNDEAGDDFDDGVDPEIVAKVWLIQELTEQCESPMLEEDENLVSDDEVELV